MSEERLLKVTRDVSSSGRRNMGRSEHLGIDGVTTFQITRLRQDDEGIQAKFLYKRKKRRFCNVIFIAIFPRNMPIPVTWYLVVWIYVGTLDRMTFL